MAALHLLLGLGGLLIGSELAVLGSVGLARIWGWPSWLTGLLLLALGTSLPEFFVCVAAAPDHPTLALGNVFGSNAFNVGVVWALALVTQRRARLPSLGLGSPASFPLLIASLAAFWIFGGAEARVWGGPLLVLGYLWILWVSLRPGIASLLNKREPAPQLQSEDPASPPPPLPRSLLLALGGFGLLALSSDLFLDGALEAAEWFGWEEGLAGYLITAVGTSAPELFTSLRAVRHGHAEAVYGNLLGSNAFNLLLAGGAVALLAGQPLDREPVRVQLFLNLAATLMLLSPAVRRKGAAPASSTAVLAGGLLLVATYLVGAWFASGT